MLRSLLGMLMLASAQPVDQPSDYKTLNTQTFDASVLLEAHPIPQLKPDYLAPDIEAKAALLMDYDTGIILYEKNAYEALPMASLTKIMTAILILENHSLDEVVTVQSDFNGLEGVRIWLRQYEKLTIDSLLKALLIRSAGDAAIALAEYHSGSVEAFVDEMNVRAKELQLNKTFFENPIGRDAEGHLSSAYDPAMLSRYAMSIPEFRKIVAMEGARIESVDGRFTHEFQSTNYLLGGYLNVLGVKTGTTYAAGQSLINLAKNDEGREVIAVLLNSPRRFQENKSMLDWAFRSYLW